MNGIPEAPGFQGGQQLAAYVSEREGWEVKDLPAQILLQQLPRASQLQATLRVPPDPVAHFPRVRAEQGLLQLFLLSCGVCHNEFSSKFSLPLAQKCEAVSTPQVSSVCGAGMGHKPLWVCLLLPHLGEHCCITHPSFMPAHGKPC